MQGRKGKCKDKKENARTKRKMQGRHKKLFLGLLRASRAIKNHKGTKRPDLSDRTKKGLKSAQCVCTPRESSWFPTTLGLFSTESNE